MGIESKKARKSYVERLEHIKLNHKDCIPRQKVVELLSGIHKSQKFYSKNPLTAVMLGSYLDISEKELERD